MLLPILPCWPRATDFRVIGAGTLGYIYFDSNLTIELSDQNGSWRMSNRAEIERELINQILESDKLEGVPLVWLQTRLGMLVSGIPPEKIFYVNKRLIKKCEQ